MNMMTGFALAAGVGVVVALIGGIAAMVRNGEVAHLTSERWMRWRVIWQGVALLFIILGLVTPAAAAQDAAAAPRVCAVDYAILM